MKTIKATGEQVTETRQELAQKYFDGLEGVYGKGNMGIVSLLSDLQEEVSMSDMKAKEHYRQILNDVKCILIGDDRKEEGAVAKPKTSKPKARTLKQVNAELDELRKTAEVHNFQFTNEADKQKWQALRNEAEAIKEARKQKALKQAKGNKDYQAIYDEAEQAGLKAGQDVNPNPMVVQEVGLDDKPYAGSKSYYVAEGACGFGWVVVRPSNSAFGRWLKAMDLGHHGDYERGVVIWCGHFNQSVARKEAWAYAFAEVLRKHGINANGYSRLD